MHIYIANLYNIKMTIAVSRQTIDILQPIYDTIDKAVRSVSGISCEVSNIISKYLYNSISYRTHLMTT